MFTGIEDEPNIHGGAMWARMPITALIADEVLDEVKVNERHICEGNHDFWLNNFSEKYPCSNIK